MKYEQIKPYIEDKLVSDQSHPDYPNFHIFNYTHKCQFKQAWDEVTIQCRGLILDISTGATIARPFPKFFNLAEHTEDKPLNIQADEEPLIYEKYDGSLGILYWLNDEPHIATRGSFTSEQALWANKWMHKIINDATLRTETMPRDITMLYEIIWKPNRIVVNYDFEGLVYLDSIDIKTGNSRRLEGISFGRMAERIHQSDWKSLEKLADDNREGFVIFFPKSNLRVKVKFDEYVRLHKILTGLSEKGVWEYLKENGVDTDVMKIAEDAPDEFYAWLKKVARNIMFSYKGIEAEARQDYAKLYDANLSRKDQADLFKKTKYPQILFAELDNKPWEHLIWKLIKPHGKTMTVFKQDIDA